MAKRRSLLEFEKWLEAEITAVEAKAEAKSKQLDAIHEDLRQHELRLAVLGEVRAKLNEVPEELPDTLPGGNTVVPADAADEIAGHYRPGTAHTVESGEMAEALAEG